jgi:hypothetical protein
MLSIGFFILYTRNLFSRKFIGVVKKALNMGAIYSDFPNLPDYRDPADEASAFLRGRPLGRLGFGSSVIFFLGRPRFLGAGLGSGSQSPNASNSSNTHLSVCTQYLPFMAGFSFPLTRLQVEDKSFISSPYDI